MCYIVESAIRGIFRTDYISTINTFSVSALRSITDIKKKEEEQKTKTSQLSSKEQLLDTNLGKNDQTVAVFDDLSPFEEVNRKMLVLNELSLNSNPFYLLYRGYRLLEYWSGRAEIGEELTIYIKEEQNMAYPQYIYELCSMYFGNNVGKKNNLRLGSTGLELDLTFIYFPAPGSEKMFENFSQVLHNPYPIRLTSIRKYPFYKTTKGYCVIDSIFMLEKGYSQFINDFWFDRVRQLMDESGKNKFPIRRYRGLFGGFVEEYFGKIIDYAFEKSKHFHIYKFDKLKVFIDKHNVELLDIYIRNSNNIFRGEVKSTGIYDNEKYSGDLDGFYRHDREGFFNAFGMGQIFRAIELLDDNAKYFDPRFPSKGSFKLYPALIVNEKVLQTPIMAKVFNDYFMKALPKGLHKRVKIQALSIIHISDWENMEDHLRETPTDFFKIMKFHVRDALFIPPFYNSVVLKQVKQHPKKVWNMMENLVQKYQRENSP